MANKEKRPAEMETPTGTVQITFPDYNMFTPEEQEKAAEIMELIWMAFQVNGLSARNNNRNPENRLPTSFVNFSGHVASVEISCHMTGYRDGYDSYNPEEFQKRELRFEKDGFYSDFNLTKKWLHGILERMKHDA